MSKKSTPKATFDKYELYSKSVQAPDTDVEFFVDTYKELRGQNSDPKVLREDFCGGFLISCEWVKSGPHRIAHGLDLDSEPLHYGEINYKPKLSDDQQSRLHIHQMNVLDERAPKADIIGASNFSYYIFKQRDQLKQYFKSVHKKLNKNGIFIVDCFGGSQCFEPNEEETNHGEFSYFWDQDAFDPVTNHAMFYIHFKRKGEKKREKVFTYDWRMWSIPEIREIMIEAGFSLTHVYWEGTDEDGEGDGDYKRVKEGEACESWVAYIAAEK